MTTVISFLLVLGVLIFIHELGHFAVAKWANVGVERFSLGFGPRLIKVKRKETEYCISLIPFGGYVKMVGENPDEEVKEEDEKRSFSGKPLNLRALIVAAGSVMNLVLALFLFPLIFMLGIEVPAYIDKPAVIGYVAKGEAGDKAGLKKGDTIEGINSKKVATWEDFFRELTLNPDKSLSISIIISRDSTVSTVTFPSEILNTGMGVYPLIPPVIGDVSKGFPAEKAGLKSGDVIKTVDGMPISHWVELQEIIKQSAGKKVFLIERGEKSFQVEIVPVYNGELKAYIIGVMQGEDTVVKRHGFFESVRLGLSRALDMVVLLFVVIKGLIVGTYSVNTLGGPIMIAQVAGRAAESGIVELFSIIAFLSLQLGIINLLPIPVLDGGHLFFFLIEKIRGKPLSEKIVSISQQIGMTLLIALMVFVTWNDILRLFE